jgi:hypothetical protein
MQRSFGIDVELSVNSGRMRIRPKQSLMKINNLIKNQSVELLIGQETLVRTRRKPERTNADFPEFNLLCCDTQVFDRDQEVLDGEFDPGSGRTLAACLTHASRTESMV